VIAAPQASKYTGWSRNWCRGGVPELGGGFDCGNEEMSVGGQIYSVRLSEVRVILGHLPHGITRIGLPSHALVFTSNNRQPWLLALEPAPADFMAATGLAYIAIDEGGFTSSEACLEVHSIEESFGVSGIPTAPTPPDFAGAFCYTLRTLLAVRKNAR
jgi:hypothetical protein